MILWFCFACSQATGMGLVHETHMEISSLCYWEDQFQQSCLSVLDLKSWSQWLIYFFLKMCCLAWHAYVWNREREGFQQCWTCARRKWVSFYLEINRNINTSGVALKWGRLEFVKMLWPWIYDLQVTSGLIFDAFRSVRQLIFSVKSMCYPFHKGLLCAVVLSSSGLASLDTVTHCSQHISCTLKSASQPLYSALYKQLVCSLECWLLFGEQPVCLQCRRACRADFRRRGLRWPWAPLEGKWLGMLMGVSSECGVQVCSMPTSHLETRELCLGLAWHVVWLKPRMQRQLCDPPAWPLTQIIGIPPYRVWWSVFYIVFRQWWQPARLSGACTVL